MSFANFDDRQHRQPEFYRGEKPQWKYTRGPESIKVTLEAWGPNENVFATVFNKMMASWGADPPGVRSDGDLDEYMWDAVETVFAGRSLPQHLEFIGFSFCLDGITRAETHQHVRTRIGAGFSQHGGRGQDWRHRNVTMPEAIARAIELHWNGRISERKFGQELKTCVTDWQPLWDFVLTYHGELVHKQLPEEVPGAGHMELMDRVNRVDMEELFTMYMNYCKMFYAMLVDMGFAPQDARRFLPIGHQTYLYAHYNMPALKSFLSNRLEHTMDWEINCVAQLMLREVRMRCPPLFSKYMGSHSDLLKRAVYAKQDMFPPDGKWPLEDGVVPNPPMFPAEANPFWVLHPSSMKGGPVIWIPTNGSYPHEVLERLEEGELREERS